MKWNMRIASQPQWSGEISNRAEKERVAAALAARVKDGEVIGFGSGSTSFLTILAIGARVEAEGLRVTAIPTSLETALTCGALGIPTANLFQRRPDWAFDGADEVDSRQRLIKGRGGAMFREKIMMASAPLTCILVDPSKRVQRLGEKFPVPVEVLPDALNLVEARLAALGAHDIALRPAAGKDGPIITESGGIILDARFDSINDDLEAAIKAITGVFESGLFIGYPVEVLTA